MNSTILLVVFLLTGAFFAASFAKENLDDLSQLEHFQTRPCTDVLTDAERYCKPLVTSFYHRFYLHFGRDQAICPFKVAHYRCLAEAICLECSSTQAYHFDRTKRQELKHLLTTLPPCVHYKPSINLDHSFCDYLDGIDAMPFGAATADDNATSASAITEPITTTTTAPLAKDNSSAPAMIFPLAIIILAFLFGISFAIKKWYMAVHSKNI